jgi:hypothetical protein
MKIPKFPTKRELAKLSRAELTERLQAHGLEWQTLRNWALEDIDDPFLAPTPKDEPSHEEKERAMNLGNLHMQPFRSWISTLTARDIERVRKEYKVPTSAWTKRTASLEDSRRLLGYALASQVK